MTTSTAVTIKGGAALATNALAISTSMQHQIEWALRCTSLLIGITVGILTAWSIVRKRGRI